MQEFPLLQLSVHSSPIKFSTATHTFLCWPIRSELHDPSCPMFHGPSSLNDKMSYCEFAAGWSQGVPNSSNRSLMQCTSLTPGLPNQQISTSYRFFNYYSQSSYSVSPVANSVISPFTPDPVSASSCQNPFNSYQSSCPYPYGQLGMFHLILLIKIYQ